MMVCILHNLELPLAECPRDWSNAWDQQQPPLKGQLAFCTMLVGVARRARWQPRTLDSMPPVVHMLGACVLAWSRSREAATDDVARFNANQLRSLKPRGVRLWAAVGWGVTGYPETIRVVEREVKGGGK